MSEANEEHFIFLLGNHEVMLVRLQLIFIPKFIVHSIEEVSFPSQRINIIFQHKYCYDYYNDEK